MLKVGVVIPLHNHREWIGDALQSIANQTWPHPLPTVVVDDGSTDDSLKVLLGMLKKVGQPAQQAEPKVYKGIFRGSSLEVMVVSFQKAHGPSFARNWGMKSLGDLVDVYALLDSDDMFEPDKIALSAPFFDDPNVGIVYSDFDTLNGAGMRLRQWKEPFSRFQLLNDCIINCDSLISRKAVEVAAGFDEDLRVCEDYDVWLRITEQFLAIHIPQSLVTVRVGEHSSSSMIQKERWEKCYRRVFEKLQQRTGSRS